MGNSASSNLDTINPLQIPDSHFDKYGLNETKTVLEFKVMAYNGEFALMFRVPKTCGGYSHIYVYHQNNKISLVQSKPYFYVKNVGYILALSDKVSETILKTHGGDLNEEYLKPEPDSELSEER